MSKPMLSQNRKIYLDKGYLMHLTIKWKDVTKNEQARATVMGVYEGKLEIPFTLLFIGHNGEVLKEVTQQGTLEKKSCSAISRFNIKSLLGNLKEEDIDKITVKIEMNDQRLDVPCENDWLRIGTTCLERFHEAIKQNDAKKHPSEKDSYFKWVRNKYTPSKIQLAEAVQDQFNFGSGAYNCDPEAFEFEVNMDIRKQIHDSLLDVGAKEGDMGAMHKAYLKALKQRGKPVEFRWLKKDKDKPIGFGGDTFENIKTKAWPFGRTSAILTHGKITVCEDGKYFVEGVLEFEDDDYSWDLDGFGMIHNAGISTLGSNVNSPGLGNWQHMSKLSEEYLGKTEPSMKPNPPVEVVPTSPWSSGVKHEPSRKDAVAWNKASEAYKNNGNKMPIKYTKNYHFYIFGVNK